MAVQNEPTPLDLNWYQGDTTDLLRRGFNLIADNYFGYVWTLDSSTFSNVGDVFSLKNAAIQKWIKEEAILGETDEMYNIGNSYYALIYAYLIARSVREYGNTLEQAKLLFNYTEVKKCFACKGINLDDYLAIFELVKPANCGIEHIAIEYTFQIENAVDCGAVVQKYIPKGEEGFLKNLNLDTCSWFIPTDCRCLTTFKPTPKFPNWGSSSSSNACDCNVVNYFSPGILPPTVLYTDGVTLSIDFTTLPTANTNIVTYTAVAFVSFIDIAGADTSLGIVSAGDNVALAPFIPGTYKVFVIYFNNTTDQNVYGISTAYIELTPDIYGITRYISFGGSLNTSPCIEEAVGLVWESGGVNLQEANRLTAVGGRPTLLTFGEDTDFLTLETSTEEVANFTLSTAVNNFYNILGLTTGFFGWTEVDAVSDELQFLAISSVFTNCTPSSGSDCPCDIIAYNFLTNVKTDAEISGSDLKFSSGNLSEAVGEFSRPLNPATDKLTLEVWASDGFSANLELSTDVTLLGVSNMTIPLSPGKTYIFVSKLVMHSENVESKCISLAYDTSNTDNAFRAGNLFKDLTDSVCLTCRYENIESSKGERWNYTEQGFIEDMVNLGAPLVIDSTSPILIVQQLPSTISNYFLAGTLYEITGWDNLNFFFANPATPQDSPIFGQLKTNCKITKVEK